jgi:CheY-like chemotaxis protein
MVRLLDHLGYHVVCAASNGAELLESCFESKVDVVLVDLDMPIVDGLEAAEEISQKGIPVVLISGMPDSEHLVLEQEPITVRLSKPVTSEALQGAIQSALDSGPPRKPR